MFLRRIFLLHLQSSPQYLYFKFCNSYFCVFVILYFYVFVFLLIFLSPALLSTSCQYLKLGRLAVVVEHFSLSLVRLHFCIFAFLYSVFRLVQFWVQRSRPKKIVVVLKNAFGENVKNPIAFVWMIFSRENVSLNNNHFSTFHRPL